MTTFDQNVEFEIKIFGVLQARSQICGGGGGFPHGFAGPRCRFFLLNSIGGFFLIVIL